MDTSYLSSQVSTIIGQLHSLFDEIGVPSHERESRESELFAALSETLHNQVRIVAAEKNDMTSEAQRIITTIKQMDISINGPKDRHEYEAEDEDLKITTPLIPCLQSLKERHTQVARVHKERFEQVKKLVQALESYSSHLESTFIKITLPPTSSNANIPPTFDLSTGYVTALDDEFTRVYEEYTRRVATVKALSENIIQLWAELGTPQAQTDNMIVKYYRDSPEQLGLHEDDITRLRAKREKLSDEKKAREKRLKDLKMTVEGLWDRLGVDESERKQFLNSNRGCGVRQINEFEDELSRLNELKRQNLHLFVEDARYKLQELWDSLYFSEEEMLEFTPAFSDVYSDALLEAHEREIGRLEALKEQRAPTLALIDQHRSLIKDRDDLQSSSQDASRLLGRGQKGEKRDPTRLLREEKMRKRIAKDLPKLAVQLRKVLEKWEDEYGRPFLVHGERYLDELEASEAKPAPGARSRTPAPTTLTTTTTTKVATKTGPPSHSSSSVRGPPSRSGAKTPVPGGTGGRRNPLASSVSGTLGRTTSPSKLPSRLPLSNMTGNGSPERRVARPESRADALRGKMAPPPRVEKPSDEMTERSLTLYQAPPPKMRELVAPPLAPTPVSYYRAKSDSNGSVRPVSPEDVYDDRFAKQPQKYQHEHYNPNASMHHNERDSEQDTGRYTTSTTYSTVPTISSRQISTTSSANTAISGSENWESYASDEEEPDASDDYYAKLRTAHVPSGKRFVTEDSYPINNGPPKKQRGVPPYERPAHEMVTVDAAGNRIASGSEANWTDEDAF